MRQVSALIDCLYSGDTLYVEFAIFDQTVCLTSFNYKG